MIRHLLNCDCPQCMRELVERVIHSDIMRHRRTRISADERHQAWLKAVERKNKHRHKKKSLDK